MMRTCRTNIAFLLFLAALAATPKLPPAAGAEALPARLDGAEFWRMVEEFSEPNGYFRSDNLLSNELRFQYVIPELVQRCAAGGAYLGVGPEQNFTYIAAVKPKIAFISDIRRGNLHTHLMYKGLFELSADRADFVARLFTRTRPDGLDRTSTAKEIFDAYGNVQAADEAAFQAHLRAIRDVLVEKHRLPLQNEDLAGIEYVYRRFFRFGPAISYGSSAASFGRGGYTSYADLMVQTDEGGVSRSYLAAEEGFQFVKDLQQRNLIIPLVGDFAGPKAIRAAGKYLRDHGAKVSAFYLSNVEQYLGGVWKNFCANVSTLPLDEKSTFIRTTRGGGGPGPGLTSTLGAMQAETKECASTP